MSQLCLLTVRAALVCSLILMGCSTFGFGPTERIEVPVPVYCNPPTVSSPSRPVDALTDQADVFEFTRINQTFNGFFPGWHRRDFINK